jgi:peptidoglycan/LPS O-acetylase OafA/YrhL
MTGRTFRNDIQGIRAVAVTGVLLFHLGLSSVRGGFLGVDVFFVISGYLISRHIINDLDAGSFRFWMFYYKRLRRLFPALLITVLASLIAGWFLFPPRQYIASAVASLFSLSWLSNFYFWSVAGYWAEDSITKPLLHTWSLSVEEQYYLIWPAMLWLAYRLGKRSGAITTLIIVLVFGTLAAFWALAKYPDAGFYLMPFRIFEFAIGALIMFSERQIPSIFADILTILALGAILFSYWLFDGQSVVAALVVCLATAVLIQVGTSVKITRRVLGNGLFKYIGDISYSVYLVHWPLIVFYIYSAFRPLEAFEQAALFVTSIALGALLSRTVEKPVNRMDLLTKNVRTIAVLASTLAASTAVCISAGAVVAEKGFTARSSLFFAPDYIEQQRNKRYIILSRLCRQRGWAHCWDVVPTDKKRVLIIGDSHAPDGLNMVYPALADDYLILSSAPGCPPFPITSPLMKTIGKRKGCAKINEERFSKGYLGQFDIIALSILWTKQYTPDDLDVFLKNVREESPKSKIIVFGNYVTLNTHCAEIMQRGSGCMDDKSVQTKFMFDDRLAAITKKYGGFYVSKESVMCEAGGCPAFAPGTHIPFTWDSHHLSFEFAEAIGARIKTELLRYVQEQQASRQSSDN